MTHPDELALRALVEADPLPAVGVDLTALRAAGRRSVRRRRAAAAGVALVVVAIAVPVGLVAGDGERRSAPPVAPPGPTSTATTPPVDDPARPVRGELPLSTGGSITGTWETQEPLGDVMFAAMIEDYYRLFYATRGPDGVPVVAAGLRADGGRILRLTTALSPTEVAEPDGIALWNGYRESDGWYLLLGAVPGDVDVSVRAPGSAPVPVHSPSTAVLPGFTVFATTGQWRRGWDPQRAAPLTVITSDGARVRVRGRTYVD